MLYWHAEVIRDTFNAIRGVDAISFHSETYKKNSGEGFGKAQFETMGICDTNGTPGIEGFFRDSTEWENLRALERKGNTGVNASAFARSTILEVHLEIVGVKVE